MRRVIPSAPLAATAALLCGLVGGLMAGGGPARAAGADGAAPLATPVSGVVAGASVFVYTRFGEDRNPNVNTRIDQFEAHLDELSGEEYHVLPLPRIIEALRNGTPLPDRTVAITIDDASRSAYEEAAPRLRAAGMPFTLFVASDPIDRGAHGYMSWDQVRALANAGVTIGAMTASALPMAGRAPAELKADLRRIRERLAAELGTAPQLLAYPAGEYSLAVRNLIEAEGFAAAFGQQSGVAHNRADLYALPRFFMNEAFGSTERFELAANALPLPVTDATPDDPVIVDNPPNVGFTVPADLTHLDRLACFASGQGRTRLERIDSNRFEIRLSEPFPPGRARINCTMPADEERWRWYGVQLFIPE